MAQRAIEPLYLLATNGRGFQTRCGYFVNIVGSDGENDDDDTDDSEDEDTDDEDGEDDGSEGRKKGSNEDDDEDEDDSTVSKLRKRMQAADRQNSELAKKLKKLEDKDKDELTRATERAKELETVNGEQATTIGGLRLQVAFLTTNSHSWDDPEYALDFAERRGYLEDVVDEDGTIDGAELKKALARLAKDKPSMIKKKVAEDEDEDDEPAGSGANLGSGRRKKKLGNDSADRRRRFPAAY